MTCSAKCSAKMAQNKYRTGAAAKIRHYMQGFARQKRFEQIVVAEEIGLPINAVRHAFRDMQERGEIERVTYGRYRYLSTPRLHLRNAEIKARLMRAMHVKSAFSAREIAVLADAKVDSAYRVIVKLTASEDLEHIGQQKNPRGHTERVFRVRNRDAFFLKYLKPTARK